LDFDDDDDDDVAVVDDVNGVNGDCSVSSVD
jgi:hypothetical protein